RLEEAQHLVRALGWMDPKAMLSDRVMNALSVAREAKEPVLFLDHVGLRQMFGATSFVIEIARLVELLTTDAVKPAIGSFLEIASPRAALPEPVDCANVPWIGARTDERVVLGAKYAIEIAKSPRSALDPFPRRDASVFCCANVLETVVV